jgi:NO-binding membrane sensor protein with MHYT domain
MRMAEPGANETPVRQQGCSTTRPSETTQSAENYGIFAPTSSAAFPKKERTGMNPGDIVPFRWDFSLIALSYAAAFVGSFAALQCAVAIPQGRGRVNWNALWAAAIALGGGGIWYMHFIGMSAFDAPRSLLLRYDLLMTVGSMLAAIVVAAAALYFVGRDPKRIFNVLIGGLFAGSGVAIMHYMGMDAIRMRAIIQWNPTIVAISVLIAIAAAIAALWLTFHTRGVYQRVTAALVMGVAVCGMHYTGMYAGTFVCVAESASTGPTLGGLVFFHTVFIFGVLLLGAVGIFYTLGITDASTPADNRA